MSTYRVTFPAVTVEVHAESEEQARHEAEREAGAVNDPAHDPQVREVIEVDADSDWICLCGNMAHLEGFYPCDAQGNAMEPTVESDWPGLYYCDRCHRIIHGNTHEVVSRKAEGVS